MNKTSIIRAQNLCKTYQTGSEQYHAIRNVNLDIYEGDFTVIMGNSGSGKSTLLYLLSGLDMVTAGEVYFQNQRIDTYSERELSAFRTRRIGYIYQSINLVPDLSIHENIALPGYIARNKKVRFKRGRNNLCATWTSMNNTIACPPRPPGGQQQRVAIARALINSPDILFADEPTGSLNFEHGRAVLDILTDMNREGQSVVMVTHDIQAACRADRLILIQDGKIGGILEFDKYHEHQIPERESIVFAFVSGKE